MSLPVSARIGHTSGPMPAVWGRVPLRNMNFTGREELLNRLRAGISGQVTAVVPHALQGYGGVGKTQMAVEYAHRFRADYDLVWWIPSDQISLVRPTLAALAPHLGLPPVSSMGAEEAVNAVLDCLRRGEPYARWLLIFDNADEPEDLHEYLPQGDGHVLITSRNNRWEAVVTTVGVNVFSRDESIEFLRKRVPRAITSEDADRLADELGDLPLALEQAGALQAEAAMTVPEYLRLLRERTGQLLAEGKPTEYPVPMTAAWRLSVEGLAEKLPEAIDLLRCCAFFGPEPIPRDVFTRVPPGMGEPLAGLLGNPIALARTLGEIGRYALAKVDSPSRTVQVHRLIQALLRDELTPEAQERIRSDVHRLLEAAAPKDANSPQDWQRYSELLGHIEPAGIGQSRDPKIRKFATEVVRYLYASGDYSFARQLIENFLDSWSADSAETDSNVLEGRFVYGNVLRALGEFEVAYDVNAAGLDEAENVAGEEYELALRFRNSLGGDLRARGDFRAAMEHDLRSLELHERQFGSDDRRTLRVVNNLALDYGLNSDYRRSRELHQDSYVGFTRIEEGGSPNILNGWNGLARAVRLCGDFSEACDLGEAVYAYGVDEMTAEHPWTLRAGTDLSIAYRRLGEDLQAALEVALEVHGRFVRLYGLDHPDTLAAAMALANVQRTLGDEDAAFTLASDTVQRYPKAYGSEHPYNYACAGNLAILHRVMGNASSARELNERSLAGLHTVVGTDHHYSLTVATNLASDLAELGEFESACRAGEDALGRLRTTLGEAHPTTLACAANLSVDLESAGRREEGARLYKETMDAYVRTLGLEHRDAIVAAERRHLDCDFDPPPI